MLPNFTNTGKFFSDEEYCDWFGVDMSIYCCRFDINAYHDKLFDTLDISFPLPLNNAVKKRKAEFFDGRYCAAKSLQKYGVANRDIKIGQHRSRQHHFTTRLAIAEVLH